MARRKSYREGEWFLVPFERHPGLIARVGRGSLAGFFFGPAMREAPPESVRRGLRPTDAVLIGRCTDLGLVKEGWILLACSPDWPIELETWRLPEFVYLDVLDPTLAFGRRYDSDDPFGPRTAL